MTRPFWFFWLPEIGPVKTLSNAPAATNAEDRVAGLLTLDAAAGKLANNIDFERTPVLTLTRSHWYAQNRLAR